MPSNYEQSKGNSMTNPTLEQYQKLFTENLLTEQLSYQDSENLLGHFKAMFEESDQCEEAVNRFSIYRNNVILSLSTAIADTFPVVKRLIGDACFNAAAISFVREQPPEQPSLLFYGEGFIDFIKSYPACLDLAYLSDVARLEWNYIRAFHAEDVELLDINTLQQIAPESLQDISFVIHPSVQLMQSDWPVDTIWEENLKADVGTINLQHHSGCHVLIYRQQLQVQVVNLSRECFSFLEALTEGLSIASAWAYTLEKQQSSEPALDDSELSGMLGYLLNMPLFSSLKI